MDLPKRKNARLKEYDYSLPGAYFITICTHNRQNLFWKDCKFDVVGAGIARPQNISLSRYGEIVNDAIKNIAKKYPMVNVDKYIIMPNHIHMLLQINCDKDGRPMVAPTISNIVGQMKGIVTKQIGFKVWQKLFYDHIIRNENDYKEVWAYIENNPYNWVNDKLYIP